MEFTLLQSLKDAIQVFEMSPKVATINQYIIEEDQHKFANEWME